MRIGGEALRRARFARKRGEYPRTIFATSNHPTNVALRENVSFSLARKAGVDNLARPHSPLRTI
jgi:ribosomal protein L25 (general stress protein Ctc)